MEYTSIRIAIKNFEYGIVPCSVAIKDMDGTYRPYYIELLSGINTGRGCPVKIWADDNTFVDKNDEGIIDINKTRLQIHWGREDDDEENIIIVDMFMENE